MTKAELINSGLVDANSPYLDKYWRIVSKRTRPTCGQSHHIIPRCYSKSKGEKADNSPNNLVLLSFYDHILAHFYLAKCCATEESRRGNWYAVHLMCHSKFVSEKELKSRSFKKMCNEAEREYLKQIPLGAKEVSAYGLDGKRLGTYQSICSAARETGVDFRWISACCNKRKDCKLAGGFMFRFGREDRIEPYFNKMKEEITKRVYGYDKYFHLLGEFKSLREAEKFVIKIRGTKHSYHYDIGMAAKFNDSEENKTTSKFHVGIFWTTKKLTKEEINNRLYYSDTERTKK